jgi:hypothetical protein
MRVLDRWLVKMLYRLLLEAKRQRDEARDEIYRLRAELEQLRSNDEDIRS